MKFILKDVKETINKTIEINSLNDLEKISNENFNEKLIINFNKCEINSLNDCKNYSLPTITIYNGWIE